MNQTTRCWPLLALAVWCLAPPLSRAQSKGGISPATPVVPNPANDSSSPTLFTTHCDPAFDSDDHPPAGIADGFFAEVNYLLMRPHRRDLDYAISSPNNRGVPDGTIETLRWSTESGFRIGAGCWLPFEGWDAAAYYTYLHSNAANSIARPAGGTLFATMTHPGDIAQVNTANADSGINYQVFDLEVGRGINIGHDATVRVFGGGRFAWINQSMNAFYDGSDANHAFAGSSIDFDGAGIRAGAEGHLNLRWGFNAYARGACSLLAGDFKTHRLETNASGSLVNVRVSEDFEKMVPVAELGIGVGWEYRNLQIRAGYEMTNWFGLVDLPDFVDDVSQGKFLRRTGDVSLDGLVLQVALGF